MEKRYHILLVEDDEDDYTIIRDTLLRIPDAVYQLDWASRYEDALSRVAAKHYDACLMDYRLGWADGIGLMKDFMRVQFRAPIVILTGYGDYDIDLQAMKEGAFDYLEKGKLTPEQLERSIRYAVERYLMLSELKNSENKVRTLSSRVISLQEKERKFIARELHDSIGSGLSAIKFALEENMIRMKNNREHQSAASLEQIISLVRNSIEETRRLSQNLRPAILDDFGLIPAVHSMIKDFQAVYTAISVDLDIGLLEEDVPEDLKIIIYRILQESLNNISKHSGADRTGLFLGRTREGLEITLTDNGCGFDSGQKVLERIHGEGTGLEGMRERVELSGGRFHCLSERGTGTTIRAVWSAL
jgi:signal transduction histidine kinase